MSNEVINPDQQFLDASGDPLGAGTLTFYVNLASTTLSTIYSDELLTIPQDNPYTLDAAGRTSANIKYIGKKRMVVKDFSGATVRTIDNVSTQISNLQTVTKVLGFESLEDLPGEVGQIVEVLQHTSGGLGGGRFDARAEAHRATDGGTNINSATSGVRWWRSEFDGTYVKAYWFGALYNGVTDDTTAHLNAILALSDNGGKLYLGAGRTIISQTLRDDYQDVLLQGKTITLIGCGATEDPNNSGITTIIKVLGNITGIRIDGDRSGGRDFTIEGDGGAYSTTNSLILSCASRAQWKNVVAQDGRSTGFWAQFGNTSSFEDIVCLRNKGWGFKEDGTGYINKAGASRPNDLNSCTFKDIDCRANGTGAAGLGGYYTGVDSTFANKHFGIGAEGNTGRGIYVNNNSCYWWGGYIENNTVIDLEFGPTADDQHVWGMFMNLGPASWTDSSINKTCYVDIYKNYTARQMTSALQVGLAGSGLNGYLEFKEGVTNYEISLEGTSTNEILEFTSAGAGTLTINPDAITLEAAVAPTLLNSWVNFGGSRTVAGYYKDKYGLVHLQGVIKDGATVNPTSLFVLPTGYRPAARQKFATVAAGAFGSVFIDADGNVYYDAGANTEFSLCGISFRTV